MTTRYNFAEADKFCDEIQSYLLTKEDLLLLDMGISNTGYGQYNAYLLFSYSKGSKLIKINKYTTNSLIKDEDDYKTQCNMIVNLFDPFDVSGYIDDKIIEGKDNKVN